MTLLRVGFRAMAAAHEIVLDTDDEPRARAAAEAAIADVARIEAKYSRYRDDSLLARIHAQAGGAAVPIDAETVALLRYADACWRGSQGRFDLTSGVYRRAWNFRAQTPALPAEADLAALRELVDWRSVEWDEGSIRLPRAGMEIDFGGIGKEYAADRAAAILAERGEAHGFVNLGGDVRVVGPRRDGAPWRIGIANPRPAGGDASAPVALVDLAQGALATSGDYERYVVVDGRRYCHLLDARTGWPVSHWQSLSVVAPLCVVAGSYATIAMLLEGEGRALLDREGLRWLGIAADGTRCGTLVASP